ncbi:MAG: phosphotransferase [Chakrabartia sp.]
MAISMIPPEGASAFLTRSGWGDAHIVPLAGDASFRRYFRVVDGKRHAVLMDAPPPHEDPRPFITVAEYLTGIGLSAPKILARDLEQGLLLIEDFGSDRMREAVDGNIASETDIYTGVVDVLIDLHKHAPPPLRQQSVDAFLDEVGLFPEWYCPTVGIDVDIAGFQDAWHKVLSPIMADMGAPVTVLRDYHAENIMLIEGENGLGRYGLLDFQDALAGHPAYDLVSMLEDARRDVTPRVEREMLSYYIEKTGRDERFEAAYWVLGAQRNTRILGLFPRLWKRDNKPHYTAFQPRMWGLLERNLQHSALAPVRSWFDANVPIEKRATFWQSLTL